LLGESRPEIYPLMAPGMAITSIGSLQKERVVVVGWPHRATCSSIEMLPMFAREQVSLPDHAQLIRELRGLERRTSRMGRDTVSHPPGGHDDFANALAGCCRAAQAKSNKAFMQLIRGGF
jgi:hypothetical protein